MSKSISRRGALITAATVAAGMIGGNLAAPQARAQTLGGMEGLAILPPGKALPAIRFFTPGDQPLTLAHYRGKGVVLNLWASWCGPCLAELPTLDRLAARVAADDILVLPVSSDAGGAAPVRAFYDSHAIDHLPVLLDPGGAILQAWDVPGIPVTVIFDRGGAPRARLVGGADWSSPEAVARVKSLCGPDLARSATVNL